jgi:DNA-binding PadR family transcriptional regulator
MKYLTKDPRSFLPLSPLAFQVLLSLSDESRHGYAIIQEIAERTDGLVSMRTGTMYLLLQRMVADGLIEESGARPKADDDERRRYYVVTALGRSVATAEAKRLETIVSQARRKQVLGRR